MMTSLLSIFDPSSNFDFFPNWVSAVIAFLVSLKYNFWGLPTGGFCITKVIFKWLKENFSAKELVFGVMFLVILSINVLGLMPFSFSPTSHLVFNMSFSMTMWFGMLLWYFFKNWEQLLIHLTPLGCPLILAPFMVLIELVSSLIRPVTLSLRLMANILAGHMILTLISKGIISMSIVAKPLLFLILSGFLLFEVGVAFIQAYVFTSLMFLYWEESDKH